MNELHDDHLLYIHTKKIPAIKSLIEALKEIFRDVSIKFTPKIEKVSETDPTVKKTTGGMYITALNSNSNILVRLHLEADKFCNYVCRPENKNYIMLGVNMTNLFKIIKILNNDDDLYIIYDKKYLNQLNLQYINKQKKINNFLNLLDLKEENIIIGNQKYNFVISMPSNDFHSLIKNMSIIAEQVDIKFISTANNHTLSFCCQGDFATQEFTYVVSPTNSSDNIINVLKYNDTENINIVDENIIIQGIYELKALSLFSKCSSLCPTIELYIKNDSPLVIKYRVADMGSVHLILSPIYNNENTNNDSENDSENNE